jgi:transaldolase / glucose-6-phosphate isomerase
MTNPLRDLESVGQSVWLDYIRRSLLSSGALARLIADDGVSGVTANPTIFEKAIVGSADYDPAIDQVVASDRDRGREALYEGLAVADVQAAADLLRPVYEATGGADGYVSLEVAPGLAHDTDGTVAEARRLWAEVARPNLLVKVPGTAEGVPAIERLIAEGINVNVTLLFSLSQYEAVARAFLRGVARTPNPARIASVASIFVSRIDTKVDAALDALGTSAAGALRGRIGIANGRILYRRYLDLFHGPAFEPWRARGVRPQRLLWASTSTKDPRYRDTLYLEELAGPETVTTVPPATLDAFRDHGRVAGDRLADGLGRARADLTALAATGVDLDAVTRELQVEGVEAFAASFTTLLDALETKRDRLVARRRPSLPWQLGDGQSAVDARLAAWSAGDLAHRFWRKDPTAWPGTPASDVASRMGWIGLPETMEGRLDELEAFAREVVADGIRSVVVLGMGGSSLAPDVFARVFGPRAGYPALFVLDSTHPRAIADLTARLDLPHTLFLVSSKSGTTLEPLSFYAYFREHVARLRDDAGRQFVAITDPGTPLERLAREHGFRRIFSAPADVGGRYSALTVFGLVPAALLGVDLRTVLDRARRQAEAGAFCVPASENPGFRLGAALGELGRAGRDKVTFFAEPPLEALPDWIEQLIAESTGKQGRGLVPVVAEPAGSPGGYGTDRVFVSLERAPPDAATVGRIEALSAAGHPVVRLPIESPEDLGAEFFRWETAVAVAGPVLGIDPYDQPDVELAKQLARTAMAEPAGPPAPPAESTARADEGPTLRAALERWGTGLGPGTYVGLQAYLAPALATWDALGSIRAALRRRFGCATTLGYGPRFLHSTGQLHKGGPPTGWFLQLLDEFRQDLAVPGTDYTFGRILRAQALGDLEALRQRGRPVLRVELGSDVLAGLDRLRRSVDG